MTQQEILNTPDRSRGFEATGGGSPAANSSPQALTPAQLHALLDILTHYETYAEIQKLKVPGYIEGYGYPFKSRSTMGRNDASGNDSNDENPEASRDAKSSAPVLASLLRTFVLPAPIMRDLPQEFWSERFQGIMDRFAEAELSESYDKGAMGTRKTLATAGSSIHESLTRGMFGGVPRDCEGVERNLNGPYHKSDASDLVRAWDDVVYELTYGGLVDELFDCVIEKGDLEKHSPAATAAVDYIIIHLATMLHSFFVLSPEGPYMLKLIERANKLTPWALIRQTLRIGNVATMIHGLMSLMLAKMSLGALSNWIGITSNADDGMNLVQRIISVVLGWDVSEFRKSAEKIEKAKGGPSKDHLASLRDFISKPRSVHEETRAYSVRHQVSIVAKIFHDANPGLLSTLTDSQHTQCLEYLAASLSAKDREEIIKALCRQTPDHFTQLARDQVTAMSGLLRDIHKHVDLSEHFSSVETFLNDLIATSKPAKAGNNIGGVENGNAVKSSGLMSGVKNGMKKTASSSDKLNELSNWAPSVEDYVQLLRRNRHLLYKFLHEVASKCPSIRKDARTWCNNSICQFRQEVDGTDQPQSVPSNVPRRGAAGSMSRDLQILFSGLQEATRGHVSEALDAHAKYLSVLDSLSLSRMQRITESLNESPLDIGHAGLADISSGDERSDTSGNGRQKSERVGLFGRRVGILSARSTPGDSPRSQPADDLMTPTHGKSYCGPGVWLLRWHDLLNETLITPAVPKGGPVRRGKDVKAATVKGKTGHADIKGGWDSEALTHEAEKDVPSAPDVQLVVNTLGDDFRQMLAEKLLMMDKTRALATKENEKQEE